MAQLKLAGRERQLGTWEIAVKGEVDLAVAPELQQAIRAAGRYQLILVDLSSCEFIDSTGIAVLVRSQSEFANESRRIAVFAAEGQVLRVLEMTGLMDNGLVFRSVAEAMGSVPPASREPSKGD